MGARLRIGVLSGVAVLALAVAAPRAATAQLDSGSLHATTLGWSERTWLYVLDRGAVDGGRLSDLGWLQRFHPDIDDEQAIDEISVHPGLGDEFAWWLPANGARYWAGSINHRDLIAGMDVKARIGLGRGWRVGFTFDKEDRPGLERNLPRLAVEKQWTPGIFAFGEGTLDALKPEMDVTVGGGWRDAHGEARASVTILDAFSDVIYQGLVVWAGFADTALDYEKHPYALRGTVHRRLGGRLRVELDVGAALPSTVRAYRQTATDSGFRQDEQFGMAAGLVEWSIVPRLRAGGLARWVRTVMDRTPLPLGRPEDDFRLVERTTQVGGFVLVQLTPRWRVESWLLREVRPQTKDYRTDAQPDVDYEDRAWRGQTFVRYLARFGLKAEAAFELDVRDVIRGLGQVPSIDPSLGRHNTRLRLELGWRFGNRFWVDGGYRIDLDGDVGTDHGRFDGAHGRAVLFW
jgi:hypothetical protein